MKEKTQKRRSCPFCGAAKLDSRIFRATKWAEYACGTIGGKLVDFRSLECRRLEGENEGKETK